MNERRRGLGRGLAALIPPASTERTVASAALGGTASATPSGIPGLTTDRGVAAAKVTALPPVSRETSPETEEPSVSGPAEALGSPMGAHFAEIPLDSIKPNPRQP
ncbi:chromosome partitioning protein ParB, partial [Streptomyces sp. TRM76130]|nr:chromosome partitioning protein ParB [Streptomyces sp. TRM76130]